MDARTLSPEQTRWIERCAMRLRQLDPTMEHMHAVALAFDLLRVWPKLQPAEAAEAFDAPL